LAFNIYILLYYGTAVPLSLIKGHTLYQLQLDILVSVHITV